MRTSSRVKDYPGITTGKQGVILNVVGKCINITEGIPQRLAHLIQRVGGVHPESGGEALRGEHRAFAGKQDVARYQPSEQIIYRGQAIA